MSREGAASLDAKGLEVSDGGPSIANADFDIRLETAPARVVVGLVPLVLQVREEAGEVARLLRKGADLAASAARLARLAVIEGPIRATPGLALALCLADERVRAASR